MCPTELPLSHSNPPSICRCCYTNSAIHHRRSLGEHIYCVHRAHPLVRHTRTHRHSDIAFPPSSLCSENGSAALRSAGVVRSSEMDRSHHMRAYALDPSSARRPATKGPCRARRTGYLVLDPNLWAVAACARCPGVLPSYPATPGNPCLRPSTASYHVPQRRTAGRRGSSSPFAVY
jgi:hypothetical protein